MSIYLKILVPEYRESEGSDRLKAVASNL
jgi:hypothetical protein